MVDKTYQDLLDAKPFSWVIDLSYICNNLAEYRGGQFKTAEEFITAPVSAGGLSMTARQVECLLMFNERYHHKIKPFKKKHKLKKFFRRVMKGNSNG